MTHYETAFLISPNLEEEETEKLITQMAEVISKKKGKMINEDRWGKRRLAYPIMKFEEAFYVFFHYEGEPEIPLELERRFKQTEAVLRYLTVKKTQKENVRRKKAVPADQGKTEPPQEETHEAGVVETEMTDKKKEEKTEAGEKTDAVEAEKIDEQEEVAEKEEKIEKEEAAGKQEDDKKKKVAEEEVTLEKDEAAEKKEDAQENVVPPEKSKEK